MAAAAGEGADGDTCIIRCFITFSVLSHKERLESRGERGSWCRLWRCEKSQVSSVASLPGCCFAEHWVKKVLVLIRRSVPTCAWDCKAASGKHKALEQAGCPCWWPGIRIHSKLPGRLSWAVWITSKPLCYDQPGHCFLIISQSRFRDLWLNLLKGRIYLCGSSETIEWLLIFSGLVFDVFENSSLWATQVVGLVSKGEGGFILSMCTTQARRAI